MHLTASQTKNSCKPRRLDNPKEIKHSYSASEGWLAGKKVGVDCEGVTGSCPGYRLYSFLEEGNKSLKDWLS